MTATFEVFRVFLHLGLTSFGGPLAHLGYFHRELVERRRWVTADQYAQLLAICQFLPGPASSQLGFSLGLLRAGWPGALAAFVAFTLPSAMLLYAFALIWPSLVGGQADIQGLKLVALAVVAHGLLGMAARLCPDAVRASIAALAAALILLAGSAWLQLMVVAGGALAGVCWCRELPAADDLELPLRHGHRSAIVLLAAFGVPLLALPWLAAEGAPGLFETFYRAGALVFGGGHVVLPLLEQAVVVPQGLSADQFLAGYGAAQAVPGPMFSFAAYLGALVPSGPGGAVGAAIALLGIFLPGFLLLAGVLPFWRAIMHRRSGLAAVAGVNAAVVGLLGAALYDPIFVSAVASPADLAIAVVAFALLRAWNLSALWVVLWCVLAALIKGVGT